jgi:hypothetical protein
VNKSSHAGLRLESKRILACDNIDAQNPLKPNQGSPRCSSSYAPGFSVPVPESVVPRFEQRFQRQVSAERGIHNVSLPLMDRGQPPQSFIVKGAKYYNSYRWTERLLLWAKASPTVAAVIIAVAIPSNPALMKPRNRSVSKDAAPAVE